jgi:hypothetical protein
MRAAALSNFELAAEVARRLQAPAGRGAAAPRDLEGRAAEELRLVDDLCAALEVDVREVREAAAVVPAALPPAEPREEPEGAVAAPGPAGAVPAEWLRIATEAGRAARGKLEGLLVAVPEVLRPDRYPAKKYFVVAAAAGAVAAELAAAGRPARGYVVGSYCEAEGYVSEPGLRGTPAREAVFCGFHSLEEAEAYWAAAHREARELVRLPRRRFR